MRFLYLSKDVFEKILIKFDRGAYNKDPVYRLIIVSEGDGTECFTIHENGSWASAASTCPEEAPAPMTAVLSFHNETGSRNVRLTPRILSFFEPQIHQRH